jgi:RES domain-containing protein
MRVWRIASETSAYAADDLTGLGAYKTGGRWNSKNQYVLYCAQSPSLACLETLVHLHAGNLPLRRYLVAIDIPEMLWKARQSHSVQSLPTDWDKVPTEPVSCGLGDDWLKHKQSTVLAVPSAIVPEEAVILINPRHADARKIKAEKVRVWQYDQRLIV